MYWVLLTLLTICIFIGNIIEFSYGNRLKESIQMTGNEIMKITINALIIGYLLFYLLHFGLSLLYGKKKERVKNDLILVLQFMIALYIVLFLEVLAMLIRTGSWDWEYLSNRSDLLGYLTVMRVVSFLVGLIIVSFHQINREVHKINFTKVIERVFVTSIVIGLAIGLSTVVYLLALVPLGGV